MCRLVQKLRQVITVEPVLFLFMTALFLQSPAYQQLILTKVCDELYDEDICANLQQNLNELEAVQSKASYIILIYIAVTSLMSVIPSLLLGAWSDHGSRKVGMLLPSICSAVSGGLLIIISCIETMSVYWTYLAAAIFGISGGHVAIFLSVFSYLADITENSQRTKRMGIAESMIFVGGTVGFLLGGSLLEHSTFTVIFSVYCGFNLLSALYVLLWLQEPKQSPEYNKTLTCTDDNENQKLPAKLHFGMYICESFKTVFKQRRSQDRFKLHLLLLCVFIVNVCSVGEQSITLMFVSYPPRNFSNELFGIFTATKMLLAGVCLLFSFPLLLRCFGEMLLAKAGAILRAAALLLMAFSTNSWMLFISAVLNAPGAFTGPVLRSLSSQIVEPDEQGAMFSFMASLETICLLVSATIFNGLYPATLSSFPGMCFIVMATFQLITLVFIQWISEMPTTHPQLFINEK